MHGEEEKERASMCRMCYTLTGGVHERLGVGGWCNTSRALKSDCMGGWLPLVA